MLRETGVSKRFIIMTILRSPFDILNAILTANLMQSFIRIIEQEQKDMLWKNVLIFLVFSILLFGYNMSIWSTIAVKTTVLLQKNLRKKVFDRIMELSPEELQGAFGADWFTRLNNDIDKACGYLMSPLNYMHMVIALVNLCISSVILVIMNVKLYIIGMCWVFAAFILNILVISKKIPTFKANAQKRLVEYTDLVDTASKNSEAICIFEGEAFIRKKIEEKSYRILKENMKVHNRASLCNMTYAFSGMLGYLMMLLGGNDIIGAEIPDFATLCKLTQYRANSVMSVNVVYNSINNMKGSLVGVDRVNEVLCQITE